MTGRDGSLFVLPIGTLPPNPTELLLTDRFKKMIEQKKEDGWEFLFLGANIDAAAEARRFGIDAAHAVDYHSDSQGTQLNYRVVGDAISHIRTKSTKLKSDCELDFAH